VLLAVLPDASFPVEATSKRPVQHPADAGPSAKRASDALVAARPDAAADALLAQPAEQSAERSVAPELAFPAQDAAALPEQASELYTPVAVRSGA